MLQPELQPGHRPLLFLLHSRKRHSHSARQTIDVALVWANGLPELLWSSDGYSGIFVVFEWVILTYSYMLSAIILRLFLS